MLPTQPFLTTRGPDDPPLFRLAMISYLSEIAAGLAGFCLLALVMLVPLPVPVRLLGGVLLALYGGLGAWAWVMNRGAAGRL